MKLEKKNCLNLLRPVNITLFGKGIFISVIKLRVWRWDHHRLSGRAINPMTNVLLPHKSVDKIEEKEETEIGIVRPLVRESLELLEAGEGQAELSCTTLGGSVALRIPWFHFWPPELWESAFLLYEATMMEVSCYGDPRKSIPEVNLEKLQLLTVGWCPQS